MTTRRFAVLALAVALLGLASRAEAQCRVRVDATLLFGTYDVFSDKPLLTTGQVSWRCPPGQTTAVQVTLTRGGHGDSTSRRLSSGGEFLRYELYFDSARTMVWGDGTYGTAYSGNPPGGGWVPLNVYGRIFVGQDVTVGTYTDSVTVVINF